VEELEVKERDARWRGWRQVEESLGETGK